MSHPFTDKIVWLGHGAFRINAVKTIYIDPFELSSQTKADLVLITHSHFDHCSPEDVEKIQSVKTIIVTEKSSAGKLSGDVRIIAPGESLTIDDVKIDAVSSYNTNEDFHPKDNGWLGFIVEIEGTRIYHAGDTDFIPEMKNIDVDIALLPVSGTYVMTAAEAVAAALAISPKIAIPMHYGSIVGSEQDAIDFKKGLDGKIEVLVPNKEC